MRKRQLTIKDIATALHISISTVSRALSDSHDISAETKKIVSDYANAHNYKPNQLALSLRTSNTRTIGVILPQIVHYFFSTVLSGIEDEAERGGYKVLFSQSDENYEHEVKGAKALLEARVCGVLSSMSKTTQKYNHFQELVDEGIPLVFFDRICPRLLTDRVVVDDYEGVKSAVNYLIHTGCRRIAFLSSPLHLSISSNRRMGYEDALRQNGIEVDPELVHICDNYEDTRMVIPPLLSMSNRPDAIFAVNDETAIGAMTIVKEYGIKIPEEISICGFTNNNMGTISNPTLTSVDQHGFQMGVEATRILIDRIENRLPSDEIMSRIIRTSLVVRKSTR